MGLRSSLKSLAKGFLEPSLGGFSLFDTGYQNAIDLAVEKYKAVNNTLAGTLGCKVPAFDPYHLLALLTANGYHQSAIYLKSAATVGQGYTGSDALLEHLIQANADESFDEILAQWAFDVELGGNGYIRVIEGQNTAAIYSESHLKTRIKIDDRTGDRSFLRYDYEYGSGTLGWTEYPQYTRGDGEGMRHFKLISPSGNKHYGEPEYTSINPLLQLNTTIVDSALRFFKHALQADMAMIMKGGRYKDDELRKIREYMQKQITGIDNARKLLFLKVGPNEDVKFEKLNAELQTSETGKMRNDNRDEIATAHRVGPRLLGIVTAGSLGGPGELEAQLKAFKLLYADARQRRFERWWQDLFAELGFPDPYSFKLKPMEITTGTLDAQTLATLVGIGALSAGEARNEWLNEKSMGLNGVAKALIALRKQVEYGE